MPLLEGYAAGLALIVLVGPVLFVLVHTTLSRGRRHGFAVVAGIFVSDVAAVLLCALGAARYLQRPAVEPWLALGGGLLVLGFGLRYLLGPILAAGSAPRGDTGGLPGSFARGFAVNFVNPFVFAVWLGIVAVGVSRHGAGGDLAWFLSGAVLGILTLDSLKVLLAHRIRPLLGPRTLRVVFRTSGVLLAVFGVRLLAVGLAF